MSESDVVGNREKILTDCSVDSIKSGNTWCSSDNFSLFIDKSLVINKFLHVSREIKVKISYMSKISTVHSNNTRAETTEVNDRVNQESICKTKSWLNLNKFLLNRLSKLNHIWLNLLQLCQVVLEKFEVAGIHTIKLLQESFLHQ